MPHYDLFVIGGGPAGSTLAEKASRRGLRVGIAEPRGLGGACALRGCDPKRIMVSVTEAADGVDRLRDHGIARDAEVDWPAMRRFVREYVDARPADNAERLRGAGVAIHEAYATFTGPHALRLRDARDARADGGTGSTDEDDATAVTAEHIVIATGQHPAPLGIDGEAFAKTSAEFHDLEELPSRVVFIGGGYIGLESAHICRRAGAEVTVLHNDDDPLPMFDRDVAQRLLDATRELGIDVHLDREAAAIERAGEGAAARFRVSAKDPDGKVHHYDADLVMNTAGRAPTLDGLDLAAAGIEAGDGGVPVDKYLRVVGSGGKVFAIGDVTAGEGSGPPLTPVAQLDAEAVLATITRGRDTAPDFAGVPTAVYTLPELALVGLTRAEAEEKGLDFECSEAFGECDRLNAYRVRARGYGHRVLIERGTGRILGAQIFGPMASEAINLFALAIRAGITRDTLRAMPWAYPTWGSDVSAMV